VTLNRPAVLQCAVVDDPEKPRTLADFGLGSWPKSKVFTTRRGIRIWLRWMQVRAMLSGRSLKIEPAVWVNPNEQDPPKGDS